MRNQIVITILMTALICFSSITLPGSDRPVLKGPYLGQEPPDLIPKIFAPGIISGKLSEGCSGWGNKMEYFLFQRWIGQEPKLYIMEQVNGIWKQPRELVFGRKYRAADFTLAPDGITLYFASRKFVKSIGHQGEGGNIWLVKKTGQGWTEPQPLDPPLNTRYHDSYPSAAANSNLYFFSRKPGGLGRSDLYMAKYTKGKYDKPVNLGKNLNTEHHEWDPYIARDESYMIYCSTMPGGLGEDDLYITFKNKNGAWGKPIHLGNQINTDKSENRPYVTPDGKFLFYTSTSSGKRDIYWVSTKIIDVFKVKVEKQ